VKLDVLAKGTRGSPARSANLANEAAIHAAGINLATVTMDCFEMAKDKVMMGRERRSMIITTWRKIDRLPRGGHAIVATLTPGADPITRSASSPGDGARITQQLPIDERHTYSQVYLKKTSRS